MKMCMIMIIPGEWKKSRFIAQVASWEMLSGAQTSQQTEASTSCSAKTKIAASYWSIYFRDFTHNHLVGALGR